MKKLLVLAGGIFGYVLGTRAGRERYAQIKRGSLKVWRSKPVQTTVDEAQDATKNAAAAAGSKVSDAATAVKQKVAKSSESDPPPPSTSPESPVVAPTGSAPQEGIENPSQ